MESDTLKREFIDYMEKKNAKTIFPPKYIGCLMAILVEQRPLTQERIEKLTGYSQTTISQMLKLIQMILPLKKVTNPGERKKYYKYDVNPTEFMINFFQEMIDAFKTRVDFLLPLIEEISGYTEKHVRFKNFKVFLERFYEISKIIFDIISESKEDFKEIMKTGRIDVAIVSDLNLLRSSEMQEFIQDIMRPPKTPGDLEVIEPYIDDSLYERYLELKQKYFQKARENFDFFGSPKSSAMSLIITEMLIEQKALTQEELERSTKFQRSVISETLKMIQRYGLVSIIKKPGDRRKYYQSNLSWNGLVLNKFTRNIKHAKDMKNKIKELIEKSKTMNDDSEEYKSLLRFFKEIYQSYEFYEVFIQSLEARCFKILREKANLT